MISKAHSEHLMLRGAKKDTFNLSGQGETKLKTKDVIKNFISC